MTNKLKDFISYILAMAVITMFIVYHSKIEKEMERKRELEREVLMKELLEELENEPQMEVKK